MTRLDKNFYWIRRIAIVWLAAGFLATSFVTMAQDESATPSKDVILARKTMMSSIEEYVNRIGRMISQRDVNLHDAREYADTVSVMLMALPHLFPPKSNQWRENGDLDPVSDTMASPDIWTNYDDFYQLAATAAKTAYDLSRADNEDEVKRLHRALGTECDLCHSLYLKE